MQSNTPLLYLLWSFMITLTVSPISMYSFEHLLENASIESSPNDIFAIPFFISLITEPTFTFRVTSSTLSFIPLASILSFTILEKSLRSFILSLHLHYTFNHCIFLLRDTFSISQPLGAFCDNTMLRRSRVEDRIISYIL